MFSESSYCLKAKMFILIVLKGDFPKTYYALFCIFSY